MSHTHVLNQEQSWEMDFSVDENVERMRAEVRDFLARELTSGLLAEAYRTGTLHSTAFFKALARDRLIGINWPAERGGRGAGPLEVSAFHEEMNKSYALLYGLNPSMLLSEIIAHCENTWLKETILPQVLAGDAVLCMGYSEPDSGSDIAAAKTKARPDGDSWVINGQKVFTSNAEAADYVLLLTRTDDTGSKHQGLTLFLVPLKTPGISIHPIRTLAERTNITYYSDVRIDDRWRVSPVDGAWQVMTSALTAERGGHGHHGHLERLLEDVTAALREMRANDDPATPSEARAAECVGRLATELEVARLLDWRVSWTAHTERRSAAESSMSKLFVSEALTRAASDCMDILGPRALLGREEPEAPAGGWIEYACDTAVPMTVYGGSSEVLRSIIAEHHLGLPRSR